MDVSLDPPDFEDDEKIVARIPELIDDLIEQIGILVHYFQEQQNMNDQVVKQFSKASLELDSELSDLKSEVNFLRAVMREDHIPESKEELLKVSNTAQRAISSSNTFRGECGKIEARLLDLGNDEAAEQVSEIRRVVASFSTAVDDLLFSQYCFDLVYARYFPSSASERIPELVDSTLSEGKTSSFNASTALVMLADNDPKQLSACIDDLAAGFPARSPPVQHRLLFLFILTSDIEHGATSSVRRQSLMFLNSRNPTFGLLAGLVVALYSPTESQARKIANIVEPHLGSSHDRLVNLGLSCLLVLAESHPETIEKLVPDVGSLLDHDAPRIVEASIEIIEELGRAEYRAAIEEIAGETRNETLNTIADRALASLNETNTSEDPDRAAERTLKLEQSILAEIEEEFDKI